MAKEVKAVIKMQLYGAQATPAPPVGPALGQLEVKIGEFVRRFNEATEKFRGEKLTVVVTIFRDKTFTFVVKQPPASFLIKKAACVARGSGEPNTKKVGQITRQDLRDIAIRKMPDLNAADIQAAEKIIAGTARSMGIDIVD